MVMKIYLIDRNKLMTIEWKKYFCDTQDVEIIHTDFESFMKIYDVECVVSPANSYGIMTGGYDLAITEWFGPQLMKKVRDVIKNNYDGEQPVGTSLCVEIPNSDKKLIHTPTMRIPSRIEDSNVVYRCMKSTLLLAKEKNIHSIVIPAFGGSCGGLDQDVIASLMKKAYDDVINND